MTVLPGVLLELQRIVWSWDSLVDRLRDRESSFHLALRRSCRPLEAERSADGTLMLVLGCWWPADLAALSSAAPRGDLGRVLGKMLEDRINVVLVSWPGGMATKTDGDQEYVAPDLLSGIPADAREEAALCESPVQRYFYAAAYRRGLRPRCQHVVLTYRLDFAFPERHVAAEVSGWNWHRLGRGAGMPPERGDQLGVESWRVRWFSGGEVVADVGRCLDQLEGMFEASSGLATRRFEMRSAGRPKPLDWPRWQRRPQR